jgi:hypothetical protein
MEGQEEEPLAVKVVEMPPSPLTTIQDWLGPLISPLTTVGIVTVLVIFMLIQREDQRNRLIRLFGAANIHITTEVIMDASDRISRYLLMQFLINSGYGILVAIGLWFIGVPSAITWGVMSFALRFLPYIGPWIAAAMPVAISLAVSPGWSQPLFVILWFVILEVIAGNVVEPYLYGHSIGVSGLGIILAAIFWTWLWGPIGLVVAVPITVCLVVASHYIPQLRFVSVLIGDQPSLSMEERVYQRLLAFDEVEPHKLAKRYLADKSLESFYDSVLIPVLVLAERDRHRDSLHEDQVEFIEDAVFDLVEELSIKHPPGAETPATDSAVDFTAVRVLCVPLKDRADHTSAKMLSQLLAADGFHVVVGSTESLVAEIVEQAASEEVRVAVLCAVPPVSPRHARLLRQRLRERFASLEIVTGIWRSDPSHFPAEDDASRLVMTLAEARLAVRAAAIRIGVSERAANPI